MSYEVQSANEALRGEILRKLSIVDREHRSKLTEYTNELLRAYGNDMITSELVKNLSQHVNGESNGPASEVDIIKNAVIESMILGVDKITCDEFVSIVNELNSDVPDDSVNE